MSSLLNLPTDHMLANIAGLLICAVIMVVCVCRLNLSRARRFRVTVMQVMLISFAFWAGGTFADLWRGGDIGFHGAAAGLGILSYLLISYRHWRLQDALWKEADDRAFKVTRPGWWSEEDERAAAIHH